MNLVSLRFSLCLLSQITYQLGTRNRYKVVATTSLREILDYYCQRHDASAEAIVLRYQGKRIPLTESPQSLALPDLSIIGM